MKVVQSTEKRQKVSKRWKTGEKRFNAAALSLELKRQEAVMETTYSSAVERMFLISLKNKYAGNKLLNFKINILSYQDNYLFFYIFCTVDGQAIAIKLSKQITQRTNAIKATVTKYNASLNALEDWIEDLLAEIQFEEAKDPGSQLYCHLYLQPSNDNIPFTVKRAAIDLHNFLERCKEEQELLVVEVERLFNHYVGKKDELEAYVAGHSGDQPKLITGVIAIVKKELVEINNILCSIGSVLSDYLTVESINKIPNGKIEAEHASCELCIVDDFEITSSSTDEVEEEESVLLEFSDDDSDCDHDE